MTNEDRVVERLGRRVRFFREQADMTEEALGEELDFGHGIVSQRTISDIEIGKREIKPSELGQIARALGVTTDQLIEGLGYTGEPSSVTGGGKAGTKGRGQRG